MKNPESLLLLAAGEGIQISPEVIEEARRYGTEAVTALNTLVDDLKDPLKAEFLKIKKDINTALANLPETDKVPAAGEANFILRQLLSMFTYAQQLTAGMKKIADEALAAKSTALNGITAAVEEEITKRIGKGELFSKADHTQLLDKAVVDAKAEVQAGIQTVETRRTALASAGLPPAPKDLLALADDQFKAKETTAKARLEKLKPFSIGSERLVTLCYVTDDASFDVVHAELTESPRKRTGSLAAFMGAPAGGAAGSTRSKLGVL